jgi:flagellar biosynthesis chaperone FliJ
MVTQNTLYRYSKSLGMLKKDNEKYSQNINDSLDAWSKTEEGAMMKHYIKELNAINKRVIDLRKEMVDLEKTRDVILHSQSYVELYEKYPEEFL